MIDYYEVTALVEAEKDTDGNVTAYDYAVVQYTADENGEENEVRLMSGQADDFDTAVRNVRVKLANLDRPTI